MCSIMGYCGSNANLDIFKKGFDRTITRGPDDSRIIDTGNGFLGFHRLAIMGLSPSGMQPFELNGSFVVCNGEIYGFEQFKEQLSGKYTFQSESDCEILLPLYREYKTDMFAMLDAEFACIIYDGETGEYIAARDPVGIRPLYYGFDETGTLLLASEPKNLVGLAEAIMPFPPGHYYKNGEFICYCDIASSDTICHDDLETVYRQIHDKLVAGVKKRLVINQLIERKIAMKKRDPSLTIRALITAAEALFTQKGYYPVTIKELGEKAGCSPALISYYFGGKKDLYRAVVDRQLSIIDDLKQETKETPLDSLQKIHYFLKALLRTQLDPSGHLDLCYKELIMPSGLLDDTVWQRILSMGNYLKSLFQKAAEEGLLNPFPDERALSHIVFTVESITETLYLVKDRATPLNPDHRPTEEVLDELIDFVMTPMKRAERSPKP